MRLRPSVLGQDRSETKKNLDLGLAHCGFGLGLVLHGLGLGLAGLVLCCETRSCHARRHNDVEKHSTFSSTILYFLYSMLGTSLLWRSTVAFTFLKVKSLLKTYQPLSKQGYKEYC